MLRGRWSLFPGVIINSTLFIFAPTWLGLGNRWEMSVAFSDGVDFSACDYHESEVVARKTCVLHIFFVCPVALPRGIGILRSRTAS